MLFRLAAILLGQSATAKATGYSHTTCSGSSYGLKCNLNGFGTWPECPSRCHQSTLGAAKIICDKYADCVGITRDAIGYEPRKGSPQYHVGASALWMKEATAPTRRRRTPSTPEQPTDDRCYYEVGDCFHPDVDMDECREVSFATAHTSGVAAEVCVGAEVGAEVGVSATVSSEVCAAVSNERSREETQVVKIPGVKGKRMVGCSIGIHHKFESKGLYFVSYRQGSFTVREDSCPAPACEHGPHELGSDSDDQSADDAKTVTSSTIPILASFGALLLAE